MTSLGFENYAEALKIYLSKYREVSQRSRKVFSIDRSQTQSSRADTQGRPTSSGGYAAGGPVGGSGDSNAAAYSGDQQNTTSPTQDTSGGYYGGLAQSHNGIGGDGY